MNILITGDLHLTEKPFENRKDDFLKTSLRKLKFIFETAKENDCLCIQPGDFFDTPTPSYKFFRKVVALIKKYDDICIFTCAGQHDMRYRTKNNTALKALSVACSNVFLEYNNTYDNTKIFISSSSYNEEIPEPKEGKYNILLVHKMIVDSKLWKGQEDFSYANNFLRRNKFNLIVSGDNHAQFEISINNRFLFNCGTLIRDGVNYIDYKPYVVLFNTKTYKWNKIFVPIEPSEVVFDLNKIESEKNRDTDIEKFVSGIKNYRNMGLDFKKNIDDYISTKDIPRSVKLVFEKAFTKIGEEKRND